MGYSIFLNPKETEIYKPKLKFGLDLRFRMNKDKI